MHDHFKMMAGYNTWANKRLYDAAEALPEGALDADAGVFFGSLLGTLNHLLVGDRIWMKRLTGEGDVPGTLDAILYEDLAGLRAAREAEDARIERYVDGLDENALAERLSYTPMTNPAPVVQPRASALSHVFNHQTHHRGQAHAALSSVGASPPSLDLLVYQRESGVGMG